MLKLSAAHFVYQFTQVDAGNTVEPAEATRRLVPARERVYAGMRTQSPVTSTSGRDEGAMLMLITSRDSRLTT